MLLSLLVPHPSSTASTDPTAEDIFSSSLSVIFTDDTKNHHGDPGSKVIYCSSRFGDIELLLSDPAVEEERGLFSHYVWNAGLLMAECAGWGKWGFMRQAEVELNGVGKKSDGERVPDGSGEREEEEEERSELQRQFENYEWIVKGERVLELGAGS